MIKNKLIFTQAEWRATEFGVYAGDIKICSGSTDPPITFTELDGNMSLCAGAPDMYKALRYALECFRRLSEEGHYPGFMLAENGGKGSAPITRALEKVDGQDYSHGLDDTNPDQSSVQTQLERKPFVDKTARKSPFITKRIYGDDPKQGSQKSPFSSGRIYGDVTEQGSKKSPFSSGRIYENP